MSEILIAYFSASGVTEKVGKRMAEAVNGDVFAIRPKEPYTEADLNWKNPFARCNKEKIGKKGVPFVGKIEQIDRYGLVVIGFPIWYAGAPNIIKTFLKRYPMEGKRVAVFATSGGSRIGKSAEKLKPFLSDSAQIVGSRLFSPDEKPEELAAWIQSLPLA